MPDTNLRKQYRPFARYYRLDALGSCLVKRVRVRQGGVVTLPFPPFIRGIGGE